ncbi:MAG: hypothetical protein GY938_07175, partial [Ketobacter sp.]|nr:hypothetical protein [Ketobacter sp.]
TVDADGNNVCLVGDMMGNLWHADHTDATNSDGAFGFEPVQAVGSSSTTSSLDLASGTPYPTSGEGLAGVPVTIGYADGSLAHAIIESNTSSVLTLRALLTTAPSSGERSSAGCIPSIWKSGRFHAGDKWDASTIRSIQIGHQKDSDGEFHFAYADDEDSTLRSPDVDV